MKKSYIQIFNKETLDVKIVSKAKLILIGSLSIILLSSFSYFGGVMVAKNSDKQQTKNIYLGNEVFVTEKYADNFSEKEMIALMRRLKMRHIDIVIKQAKIESGNYKSNIFIENNNLFGMRMPGNRITLATGENSKFAVYDNWRESVIDYAIYQSTYLKNYSRAEYLQFLDRNYDKNSGYSKLINKVKL